MTRHNSKSRDLIFISHANPADNYFAIWLGNRLKALGFRVWVDLDDLKAGTRHWQEIENKIRLRTIKFLVVTSHNSRTATGVDNEINIAKGAENDFALTNFIIQLKIDNLPYTRLPPVLNDRFVISFKDDWGYGLSKLIKQLDEEGIEKNSDNFKSLTEYSRIFQGNSDKVVKINEKSFTNWLPIQTPPRLQIYKFKNRTEVVKSELLEAKIPVFPLFDRIITFAEIQTISFFLGTQEYELDKLEIPTDDWLHQISIDKPIAKRSDRRRAFNGLLNEAWKLTLLENGFVEFKLADETAHFVPTQNNRVVKQRYRDPLGRTTRPITLVGFSDKYSSLWHAAISAQATLSPIPHFSTRLHVAFTKDGVTPIGDGERAFRLRKSFCKFFWNDRWRRIYFAILARLEDDSGRISISTGGRESINVDHPITFQLPYSIDGDIADNVDENVDDSNIDAAIDNDNSLNLEYEYLDDDED